MQARQVKVISYDGASSFGVEADEGDSSVRSVSGRAPVGEAEEDS